MLNVIFDSELLDISLGFQIKLFFRFQFHRQAVRVPAGFAEDSESLHGLVAPEHIFEGGLHHMTDMRLTVGSGGAVVKYPVRPAVALAGGTVKDIFFIPILED